MEGLATAERNRGVAIVRLGLVLYLEIILIVVQHVIIDLDAFHSNQSLLLLGNVFLYSLLVSFVLLGQGAHLRAYRTQLLVQLDQVPLLPRDQVLMIADQIALLLNLLLHLCHFLILDNQLALVCAQFFLECLDPLLVRTHFTFRHILQIIEKVFISR